MRLKKRYLYVYMYVFIIYRDNFYRCVFPFWILFAGLVFYTLATMIVVSW